MKKYRGVIYESLFKGKGWYCAVGAFHMIAETEDDMRAAIDQLLNIVHGLKVDEGYEAVTEGEVK